MNEYPSLCGVEPNVHTGHTPYGHLKGVLLVWSVPRLNTSRLPHMYISPEGEMYIPQSLADEHALDHGWANSSVAIKPKEAIKVESFEEAIATFILRHLNTE